MGPAVATPAGATTAPEIESPRSALRLWAVTGLLVLLAISSYLDRSVLTMLVDPIRADLGISDFEISLLQGLAFALFYSLFGIPMGWLVDRFERRHVILVGVTLWSIAAASSGLARSYAQLFLARACVGIGESTLSPAAFSMISDIAPQRRLSLATAVFASGTLLGNATAAIVGGFLIAYFTRLGMVDVPLLGTLQPWQSVFVAVAIPGLVLAPLVLLMREPAGARGRAARKENRGWGEFGRFLKRNPSYFLLHFFGFGFTATLGTALIAWFPTYLLRHFGMPVQEVGTLVGVVTIAGGLPGFLFAGWILDRWTAHGDLAAQQRYGALAAAAMTVCGIAAFTLDNSMASIVLYGVVLFFSACGGASISHLHLTTPSYFRGRMVALYLLFYTLLGVGLGPSVTAAITDFAFADSSRLGESLGWTFAGVGGLATLLLVLAIRRAERAAASTAPPRPT